MNLFGLVGQPGSGKDTAAEYISKHYRVRHIASGDLLRDYIRNNDLGDLSRENMQKVIRDLRKKSGDDVLIKMALKDVGPDERVLISGLRHPAEGEQIVKRGGHIIAITASLLNRYERTKHRGREGDDISFEKFSQLEQNENQGETFNIKQLIKEAEYTVSNDGSYKQFIDKLDKLMSQLGFERH
jgi:dephospho-CoA kinase